MALWRIRVENAFGTLHNFSIPELGIDRDVPPQGQVEVEVVFPQ